MGTSPTFSPVFVARSQRWYAAWIFAVFAAIIAGCATEPAELPVRTQYKKDVDFSVLKNFRPAAAVAPESSIYAKYQTMAREVVKAELVARSYTRLEDGTPDFRVRSYLRFRNFAAKKLGQDPTTGSPAATKDDIRDATLVVEMLSPVDETVIWTGTVSGFNLDPVKSRSIIKAAAWRLFVEFPPLWRRHTQRRGII